MLKKFQDFAMRGNVVDLAVGVIIGVAFGKIVDSLVGDIFMPIIGAVTGGLDFSNYYTGLVEGVTADTLAEAKKQGAVLAWGNFITIMINFIIIAGRAVPGGQRHAEAPGEGAGRAAAAGAADPLRSSAGRNSRSAEDVADRRCRAASNMAGGDAVRRTPNG